jgi:hypothetical protein
VGVGGVGGPGLLRGGGCTSLTHSLKGAWFQPLNRHVRNRVQSLLFHMQLVYRYCEDLECAKSNMIDLR